MVWKTAFGILPFFANTGLGDLRWAIRWAPELLSPRGIGGRVQPMGSIMKPSGSVAYQPWNGANEVVEEENQSVRSLRSLSNLQRSLGRSLGP